MVFRHGTKKKGSRRRRRALKREVYLIPLLFVLLIYQYSQINLLHPKTTSTTSSDITTTTSSSSNIPETNSNSRHHPHPSSSSSSLPQLILKDLNGKVISRKSNSLSQYYEPSFSSSSTTTTTTTSTTYAQNINNNNADYEHDDDGKKEKNATTTTFSTIRNTTTNYIDHIVNDDEKDDDRKDIINLLMDAGITNINPSEIKLLPTSNQINDLYHQGYGHSSNNNNNRRKGPIILGLETCQSFRNEVPEDQRFIGVSGMFNSGTTAFGMSLQANCKFDNHDPQNYTNDLVVDVDGMLNQVPWAKHKNARERLKNTINEKIPKDHVLPIVLIRDPYYWMQSMCKQGYGARWDHTPSRHCPNLVPNSFDRKRFKRLKNATSVVVWMGKNRKDGPNWDSLVHLWNDWYNSYLLAGETTTGAAAPGGKFPRLMIRFEDTLFYGKQVLKEVCECAGAQFESEKFQYVVDEAKWNHKNAAQNNMISAIIKYGNDKTRYNNMTDDDLRYANEMLDMKLMEIFQYKILQ